MIGPVVNLPFKLAKQVCPCSFTPMTGAAGCTHVNPFVIMKSSSKKVKDKLFPDADFSSNTVFMALRGANQVTKLYPKQVEQGCCQKHDSTMSMVCSPLTKLFVYPARGMLMAPLISSCPAGKARYSATLKLMTGLLRKPHLAHSMPAG
jgi:hypothetical protein